MKNKKGFTLIELLAVIVILALLVAVAIPAVTKYLNTSRKGVFADNASVAISAVRNQTIIDGASKLEYNLDDINKLLEKELKNSPWGKAYTEAKVIVTPTTDNTTKITTYDYKIFLTDGTHCIGSKTTAGGYTYESEQTVADTAVNDTNC